MRCSSGRRATLRRPRRRPSPAAAGKKGKALRSAADSDAGADPEAAAASRPLDPRAPGWMRGVGRRPEAEAKAAAEFRANGNLLLVHFFRIEIGRAHV